MIKPLGLFLIAGSAFLIPSCQTPARSELSVPADVDVIITHDDELTENPSNYVDRKVYVSGQVEELLTEDAFLLDYDGFFGLSRVLILAPENYRNTSTEIAKNKNVEVIGRVELFNLDRMQRRLGKKLNPKLFAKYQNQAVIIVDSLLAH